MSSSSKRKKGEKRGGEGSLAHEAWISFLERESVFLLSRFLNDPTVGSLRDKKENYSTRRGLRVGTRFREFLQTPRGRGFSLLEFYSQFKCFKNV